MPIFYFNQNVKQHIETKLLCYSSEDHLCLLSIVKEKSMMMQIKLNCSDNLFAVNFIVDCEEPPVNTKKKHCSKTARVDCKEYSRNLAGI